MGFFSKFLKKEDGTPPPNNGRAFLPKYQLKVTQDDNGIQAELTFLNYDVTRIVIPFSDVTIAGHQLKDCKVSWYSIGDMVLAGHSEPLSATDYKSVIAGIDIDKILNEDLDYCVALMTKLFDQDRVHDYLERGKQEITKRPCGRYIGEIKFGVPTNSPPNTQPQYYKNFNPDIGKEAHNTIEMLETRIAIRRGYEAALRQRLTDAQDQVTTIQKQLQQPDRNI